MNWTTEIPTEHQQYGLRRMRDIFDIELEFTGAINEMRYIQSKHRRIEGVKSTTEEADCVDLGCDINIKCK